MTTGPALFESHLRIRPEWIDANGHLHDANYLHVFNHGIRELFSKLGIGISYSSHGHTVFNLGFNVDFIRELMVDEPVCLSIQIIDWDHKRLHLFSELHHAELGFLCATAERLFMNIDLKTRRSVAFNTEAYARIEALGRAHTASKRPSRAGRTLGIRRPAGAVEAASAQADPVLG